MADNEAQKVEVKLEYENDEESLRKALVDVQSQIRNATGTKKLVDKRLNASKRYKGRANDLRQSQSLATKISDLHIREGELLGQINKKTTAPSDNVSSRDKNAETKRREQITREASLEYRKVHDAEVLKQKAAEETAKIERDLEKERLRNQGKIDLEKQRSADKLVEQEAKAKQDKEKALAVQQLREDERKARQAADIESREKTKAARLEFDKEQEKRRNRALDLKEQVMKERKQEKKLAETRKKFSIRNLGYISKIAQKLERLSITRIARGILNAVINSTKQGVQDLYKWSQSNNGMFAKAVDSIKEDFRYISDIIGSIVGPFIEVLAPVIRNIADAFAVAAERANQFFATLLGRNGYYKAIRVAQQYAGIQNQLLGFDELNVLKGDNDTGGGMFEWKPWDGGELTKIGQKLLKSSKAMLAIGGLLMVFGHPVLGAGLIAGGIVTGFAASQDGTNLQQKVQDILDTIGAVVSVYGPYAMAMGALLAFSGYPGIGIPIMAATLTAGAISWSSIVELMRGPIGLLTGLVGAASLAIGAVIAFGSPEPRSKGIGIALMAAGAVGLVSAIIPNWNSILNTLQGIIPPLLKYLGMNMLAIGAAIAFSGANVPLGLALMAAGAASLIASSKLSWGTEVVSEVDKTTDEIGKTVNDGLDTWKTEWLNGPIARFLSGFSNGIRSIVDKRYQIDVDVQAGYTSTNDWSHSGGRSFTPTIDTKRIEDEVNRKLLFEFGLFASGGTPTTGSLFYAGEAGPELVTSMNNQSTVYNEDQLAGSLASANSGVVTAVYDMANAVVNAIERKNTSISVNDVRSAINSQALRYGL